MAETTTTRVTPVHPGLPDEIAIWEILVRLPPKALLRCRAVCHAWRCATSTRDFLLAHHSHQPSLPLVYVCLNIISFDHRPGLAAADQLQSVTRLGLLDHPRGLVSYFSLAACCDRLLVLSDDSTHFAICNPATREYAPFRMLSGFRILGMYSHPPTGEYRLLMGLGWLSSYQLASDTQEGCYVLSLGSGNPPRHIRWANIVKQIYNGRSVLLHGCLHWRRMQRWSESNVIVAFDTMAESFRQMCAPVAFGSTSLFEMDDMLGMCIFNDDGTITDIWVLQDYESEVWTFKCKIELPIIEIKVACGRRDGFWCSEVVPRDSELLVLVKFSDSLLHVDMDGKLVATFHLQCVWPTTLKLKQTLLPHAFFSTLEGYVVERFSFHLKAAE